MALKPAIFRNVAPPDVLRKLASEFHSFVNLGRLDEATYTVLAFPGMRGESTSIVDSHVLSKALEKCDPSLEPVIAVAHSFTLEAQKMLGDCGGIYFFKSDFFWTDESYRRIRDGAI